jgi:Protein of unknown function (DUF2568)
MSGRYGNPVTANERKRGAGTATAEGDEPGNPAMLAFRFGVELATYALLAWAGASVNAALAVQILLAIALPLVVAVIWFLWMAPRARRRLREPARLVAELVIFLGSAAALAAVGHVLAAVIYAVIAVAGAGLSRWLIPGA